MQNELDELHDELVPNRRPLAMRRAHWPHAVTEWLVGRGMRPNTVSTASAVFAFLGAVVVLVSTRGGYHEQILGIMFAAVAIQFRLVANLVDGMVAVRSGQVSPLGKIYNEVPDRVSDSLTFISCGCAATMLGASSLGVWAGFAAAVAAFFTAYVRVLGGSLGLPYDFSGAFDKQHRMFYMTLSLIGGAMQLVFEQPPTIITVGLIVIACGSVSTSFERLMHMRRDLHGRPDDWHEQMSH